MGPPQGRVEGKENLPRPARHTLLNASQDPIGLLENKGTLPAHGQLVVHLLSTSSPRSLSAELLSSRSAPSLYWFMGLFLPRCLKPLSDFTPTKAVTEAAFLEFSWDSVIMQNSISEMIRVCHLTHGNGLSLETTHTLLQNPEGDARVLAEDDIPDLCLDQNRAKGLQSVSVILQ